MKRYEFNSFIIDPKTIRLSKDGKNIVIELQVFETLLLLVKNKDRVVSKDELLQKVWKGREVTDYVITRTMYEIRKIIDDSQSRQSAIRTVRSVGYQFVAETIETDVSDSTKNTRILKGNKIHKNQLFRWFLLTVVLFLLLISYLLINKSKKQLNHTQTSLSNPSPNIYPVVVVLPINVEGGDEKMTVLVQSLIDYLTNQLALNLNVKVIHPDSLVIMGDELNDVSAVKLATRSDFIIQGSVQSASDHSVNLNISLYENNGVSKMVPITLGTFEFLYPNNTKELKELYRQRKLTIRSIVNIIKPNLIINNDGSFETADLEAYRMVIAAHHMSRWDDCKNLEGAEKLLLDAVKIDPEFVYAYLELFSNYYKRVWICGESTDFHQKGLDMAEVVDRLAPNSFSALAIRRSTILVESNQVEKAFEYSKNADWNNPKSIYDKSYSLRYAGFLNEASNNTNRILQLDPFFFNQKPVEHAPNSLLYQNKFSEHLALLAEPGNSYHDYYRGLNLLLSDDVNQAKIILQGVIERTPTDFFGQFSQALLYVIDGDYSKALKVVDSISQKRSEKKHSDGEMTYKLVQLYALAGAHEKALNKLQISVDQGFFPMNYFLSDPTLVSIQNSAKFSLIVGQATRRHESFAKKYNLKSEVVINSKLN